MAVLEPENNDNNDKTPKWDMSYRPKGMSKLKMEQQMQMQVWIRKLENASREQLFGICLDALVLNYGIKNFAANMAKEEFKGDFDRIGIDINLK